jgi:hypothetical protein
MGDASDCRMGASEVKIIETISIGPVAESEVIHMAHLVRDYHPCRVIGAVARTAGLSGKVLHSTWISGLVCAGIIKWIDPEHVKSIAIDYLHTVVHGMSFHAEMQWEQTRGDAGTSRIIVVVRDSRRRRIAECRVTVRDKADCDLVDCCNGLSETRS